MKQFVEKIVIVSILVQVIINIDEIEGVALITETNTKGFVELGVVALMVITATDLAMAKS